MLIMKIKVIDIHFETSLKVDNKNNLKNTNSKKIISILTHKTLYLKKKN